MSAEEKYHAELRWIATLFQTNVHRAGEALTDLCTRRFPENMEYSLGMLLFGYTGDFKPLGKRKKKKKARDDCSSCICCTFDRLVKEYTPRHYTIHQNLSGELPMRPVRMRKAERPPVQVIRVCVPSLGYTACELTMENKKALEEGTREGDLTWEHMLTVVNECIYTTPRYYMTMFEPYLGNLERLRKDLLRAEDVRFSLYPMWMPHGRWSTLIDTGPDSTPLLDFAGERITIHAVLFLIDGQWIAPVYGLRRCGHCGKEEGPGEHEGIKTCSGCHMEYYCGRECQRAAWPTHRDHCPQ